MSIGNATVFDRVRSSLVSYIKRLLASKLLTLIRYRIRFSKTFRIIGYSSLEERIYDSYIKLVRNIISFQSYLENSLSLLSFFMMMLMMISLLMVIIVCIGIT